MAKAKGKVHFESDCCKGCGLCVAACPAGIIVIDMEATNVKGYQPASVNEMDDCIACGNCFQSCPDSVVTVERLTN